MRSRVLRNDSFRLLPFFLLTSALITSLAMGVLVLEAQRGSSLAAGEVLFLVGWIGTAIFLMAGRVRTRATGLDLVLPLSARSLWLTHVSSVLLAGALVSLGPALVTAAHAHIRNPGDAVHLGVGPLGILLRLLAGLILAVALLEAHRPTLVRPPAAGREAVRVALVLLGTPMAIVLLGRIGGLGAWIAPVLAVLLGLATFRAIPEAFVVEPRDPSRRHRADHRSRPGRARYVPPAGRVGGSFRSSYDSCRPDPRSSWPCPS